MPGFQVFFLHNTVNTVDIFYIMYNLRFMSISEREPGISTLLVYLHYFMNHPSNIPGAINLHELLHFFALSAF